MESFRNRPAFAMESFRNRPESTGIAESPRNNEGTKFLAESRGIARNRGIANVCVRKVDSHKKSTVHFLPERVASEKWTVTKGADKMARRHVSPLESNGDTQNTQSLDSFFESEKVDT